MPADRYELSLSTACAAARDAYVEGSDLALTLFDRAIGLPAREASHIAFFDLVFAGRSDDLIEFTLLKAYLNARRLEEARHLLGARRPGASGVPVTGIAAVH
jgi:hypothetical protein